MYKVDHSTRQIQVYTKTNGAILTVRIVVRFKVALERDRGISGFISSGFFIPLGTAGTIQIGIQ